MMGQWLWILLLVTIFISGSAAEHSKFVTWRRDVRNSSIIVVNSDKPRQIDVGWPPLTRMEIVGYHNVSIHFTCFVNPLRKEDLVTEVKFCFGTTRDEYLGRCETLETPNRNHRSKISRESNIPVTLSFDRERGGQAVLHRIPPSMSLNEIKFFCEVGNRQGREDSNHVEIYDFRQQCPRAPVLSNEPSVLDPNRRRCFDCLPKQLNKGPKAVIKYVWKYCSDIRFKNCKNISDISGRNSSIQLLLNGTLCWSYVPQEVVEVLAGKRLKCSIGDQDIVRYESPMKFDAGSSKKYFKSSIAHMYPETNNKTIEVFSGDEGRFSLPLVFDGEVNMNLQWTEGDRLLKQVKDGEQPPTGKCLLYQNSISPECQGPFMSDIEPVKVVKSPKTRRHRRSVTEQTVEYVIKRNAVGPEVSEEMPGTVFVMDGSDGSLICRFKDPDNVISMLMIRGVDLNFESQETLADYFDYVNSRFSKVMVPLRPSVNVTRPKYGQLLEYKLVNVTYRDPNDNLSSDHYVTCIGYREKKWVKRQVLLTILPKPQIIGVRNRTDNNDGTLTFDIEVENEEEFRRLGAELTYEWTLDGQPVNETRFLSEFKLTAEEQMRYKNLSCVVKVENPTVGKSHESRVVFQTTAMIISFPNSEPSGQITSQTIIIIAHNLIAVLLILFVITAALISFRNSKSLSISHISEPKISFIKSSCRSEEMLRKTSQPDEYTFYKTIRKTENHSCFF